MYIVYAVLCALYHAVSVCNAYFKKPIYYVHFSTKYANRTMYEQRIEIPLKFISQLSQNFTIYRATTTPGIARSFWFHK